MLKLCDALLTDHSVASGTGLMNIHTLAWDRAGAADRRHRRAATARTAAHRRAWRRRSPTRPRSGCRPTPRSCSGAGDGPLANLGVGAVRPGVAACSIGTSGAMRVTVERAAVDPHGGVFCYALTQDRWTVGGAINNGGRRAGVDR